MWKLLNQAFLVVKLKSSLRNAYARHHDLTLRMLVSQMMFIWWCLTPLSTIFQLYLAISFIGGGNRRTRRKPPTYRKSLTNFIT